jgi:hypothetical protein
MSLVSLAIWDISLARTASLAALVASLAAKAAAISFFGATSRLPASSAALLALRAAFPASLTAPWTDFAVISSVVLPAAFLI